MNKNSRKSSARRHSCDNGFVNDQTLWLGGHNQYVPSITSSHIFANVTKVPPKLIGHASIDPYARPLETAFQPDCSAYNGYTCGDGYNGNEYCGLPDTNSVDVSPTGLRFRSGVFLNSFVDTDTTQSFDKCKEQVGFKKVFANKFWHGKSSYTSNIWQAVNKMDWCCSCKEHVYDPTPESTHYLQITGSATYAATYTNTTTGTPVITTSNSEAYSTSTIDRYSGKAVTFCSSGSSDIYVLHEAVDLISLGEGNVQQLEQTYCSWLVGLGDLSTFASYSITGGINTGWVITTYTDYSYADPLIGVQISNVLRINFGQNISLDQFEVRYSTSGTLYYDQVTHIEYNYTATNIRYNAWAHGSTGGYNTYVEWNFNGNLSKSYTSADVNADVATLLDQIDLGDESLNWRTDTDTTQGPLVTYNEIGNTPYLWVCDPRDYGFWDGNIQGKLTPLGYAPFWDATHINFKICDNGISIVKYPESYGAHAPGIIPQATQWLNKLQRSNLPDSTGGNAANFFHTYGSNISNIDGLIINNTMWGWKGCELLLDKPSFDFARPYGADRFQVETGSNVNCIYSASGNILNLDDQGSATLLNTGDKAFVFGTSESPDINGAWTITKDSDYQITLNTCLATASLYTQLPFKDGGTGMIGKLKWFDIAPGIGGRIDIDSISNTNPITCSLADPCNLIVGDSVTINGALGSIRSLLNGNFTVTGIIDDKNIILNINGIGQSYVETTGQIRSTGATDWAYNDTGTKGEYVVKEWSTNHRDVAEYTRLNLQSASFGAGRLCNDSSSLCGTMGTIAFPRINSNNCGMDQSVTNIVANPFCLINTPCKPAVAYISNRNEPLLDQKYTTRKHNFTWTLIDNPYSNSWFGNIIQYDQDYLFQADPCICTDEDFGIVLGIHKTCNCAILEDVGGCSGNTTLPCRKYYPHSTPVEPRTTLPVITDHGAIINSNLVLYKMGCVNIGAYTNPCGPGMNCGLPFNRAGSLPTSFEPSYTQRPYHDIYLAMKGCLDADGRFAVEYHDKIKYCGS